MKRIIGLFIGVLIVGWCLGMGTAQEYYTPRYQALYEAYEIRGDNYELALAFHKIVIEQELALQLAAEIITKQQLQIEALQRGESISVESREIPNRVY